MTTARKTSTKAAKTATPAKATTRKPAAKTAAAPKATTTSAVAPATPVDLAAFFTEMRDLADKYLTALGDSPAAAPVKATKAAAAKAAPVEEPEPEEDEEAAEPTRDEREAALRKLTVRALQKILIDTEEFEEDEIKEEKDKDTLIENILDYEFGDEEDDEDGDEDEDESDEEDADEEPEEDEEEDEDEDAEEDDDEDEEDAEYTEADLLKLSLAAARKLGTQTFGLNAADLKKLDLPGVVAAILEAQAAEEDDEESDEEEGEDEFWTAEDLEPMPIKQVREIADENGIKYTVAQGKSKSALIKLITE